MKLHILFFVFILLTGLLAGCGPKPPPDEELEQFYSDSEFVLSILYQAFSEGRDKLTFDEEREMVAYEAYYGTDSDFRKSVRDPNIKMISTGLSLMESYLGSVSTKVGNNNSDKKFLDEYETVRELMSEQKENN
jgi:hypothetical protein